MRASTVTDAGVTESVPLTDRERTVTHMAASVLLDYPSVERRAQYETVRAAVVDTLTGAIRDDFETFFDATDALGQHELEAHFAATFDLKRKCCPYLSYYATGDTRNRGMALVRFSEAYRAAGWQPFEDELPDYLPMVLEFSAVSDSPIAGQLLASHRDGIEVLRAALETFASPYRHVVAAVCRSLPELDEETRDRYKRLVTEGPPTELVGLTFLGNLEPFTPAGTTSEGVRR